MRLSQLLHLFFPEVIEIPATSGNRGGDAALATGSDLRTGYSLLKLVSSGLQRSHNLFVIDSEQDRNHDDDDGANIVP